jgi:hypothetical protein
MDTPISYGIVLWLATELGLIKDDPRQDDLTQCLKIQTHKIQKRYKCT